MHRRAVIGVGFAGVGWLGESLIQDLRKFPALRLSAVQDVRAETAARVANQYHAAWHGQRFEDLLVLPDVDLVAICTPNALHVPQAQAALRAGKHVLVQKPLALSARDAEATIALAARVRRLLIVDYSYRFLDTVGVLRQALPELGPIRAISAEFHNIYGPGSEKAWFFDPRVSGGGALVDLGVHLLDLALWLIEPRAVDVSVAILRRADSPVEQAADVRVLLDQVPFELQVSWNATLPETRIGFQVEAARGSVRWENVGGSFFHFRTRRGDEVLLDRETTLREDTLRAVCDALATGVAPPIDTRVYGVLEQAYAVSS